MPIINCGCGKKLNIPDHLAGKQIKCPNCGGVVTASAPPPPPRPTATSAAPTQEPPIVIDCGGCGKNLKIPAHLAGKTVKCPGCAGSVPVVKAVPQDNGGFEVIEPTMTSGNERQQWDQQQLDMTMRGYGTYGTPHQGNGRAVAGMVLGIVGLIAWIIPLFGLPIAIVGLVLSIKSMKNVNGRGMAVAGIVLSIIALVLTIINSAIGAYRGATGQLFTSGGSAKAGDATEACWKCNGTGSLGHVSTEAAALVKQDFGRYVPTGDITCSECSGTGRVAKVSLRQASFSPERRRQIMAQAPAPVSRPFVEYLAKGSEGIFLAAADGNVDAIKKLVEQGARPDAGSKPGDVDNSYPLHEAATHNRPDAIKALIELGADVNAFSAATNYTTSRTPMHSAAENGSLAAMVVLWENGANLNARVVAGSPINYAAIEKHFDAVKLFTEFGVDINGPTTGIGYYSEPSTPLGILLYQSDENKQVSVMRRMVELGANVNMPCRGDWTPLHMMCAGVLPKFTDDRLEAISWLVQQGANVNAKSDLGSTPAHIAASQGNVAILQRLKSLGADFNMKDDFGKTPILEASERLQSWSNDRDRQDDAKRLKEWLSGL